MSIIELLKKQSVWYEFLQYKIDGGHLTKQDEEKLRTYIDNEEYLPIIEKIIRKVVDKWKMEDGQWIICRAFPKDLIMN
mgnify:CR=1 FL=1